jgi:diacylglycerol kinase (ATP)
MRLAVYFNPTAGVRTFEAPDIAELLRAAGHEARGFDKESIAEAIQWKPDVLVAAGGDGTVARAAIELWKRRSEIALFILPMGTSNNIARTFGITDTPPILVRAIAGARDVRLDVGVATSAGSESAFVEAAGLGFFSDVLSRRHTLRERWRRLMRGLVVGEAQVRGAAAGIARYLRHAPSRHYRVVADGKDLSGDYVGVEAMNITAIGPRAKLASVADPGDGALDLVLIREQDREPLARALEARHGDDAPTLERHRVMRVDLGWTAGGGHLDDEVWPANGGSAHATGTLSAGVAGAVRLLVPRAA